MLDTYNQQIQGDVSCTIRTNINTANHHFVVEDSKVINPLKGQSDNGWHFEQQVYDAECIARAVKAGEGSGNIPKVIEVRKMEGTICLNSKVNGKQPSVADRIYSVEGCAVALTSGWKQNIAEPISVAMRGRNPNNPSERGKSNGNYKQRLEMNESGVANTITSVQKDSMVAEPQVKQVGNKQLNPFRGSVEGTSPCITSACGAGGGMTPMLTDADLETTKTKEFIEQVRGHEEMRYRIRKLTPRECFRLMGVDDADIDKIQASGISNSQQYKCAGNSIVVDVLYHIFRKMFCETENENDQLCLF